MAKFRYVVEIEISEAELEKQAKAAESDAEGYANGVEACVEDSLYEKLDVYHTNPNSKLTITILERQ